MSFWKCTEKSKQQKKPEPLPIFLKNTLKGKYKKAGSWNHFLLRLLMLPLRLTRPTLSDTRSVFSLSRYVRVCRSLGGYACFFRCKKINPSIWLPTAHVATRASQDQHSQIQEVSFLLLSTCGYVGFWVGTHAFIDVTRYIICLSNCPLLMLTLRPHKTNTLRYNTCLFSFSVWAGMREFGWVVGTQYACLYRCNKIYLSLWLPCTLLNAHVATQPLQHWHISWNCFMLIKFLLDDEV